MKIYKNQHKGIGPSYDLATVTNAYNTLEQNHLKAVEATSSLQTAVAQLDLHSSEEEFRQGLISDIQQTIDDNTVNGFKGYALDDIIAKTGNIQSNPALLGRLKANQAYKAYQAQLDQMQGIGEDTRQRFKEANPYYYEDEVVDGKVVGGTEWKPGQLPVEEKSLNEVYDAALKYIVPEKGQYTVHKYIDSNGAIYDEYTPGADLMVLNSTTTQYERVSRDKVLQAVQAALNADPSLRAGFQQRLETELWTNEKLPEDQRSSALYDNLGDPISVNTYVSQLIDPFIKSRTYNYQVSQTEWKNDALRAVNKALTKNVQQANDISKIGVRVDVGKNEAVTDTAAADLYVNLEHEQGKLYTAMTAINPDIDTKGFSLQNPDTIANGLKQQGIADDQYKSIMKLVQDAYDLNQDKIIALDSFINGADSRSVGNFKAKLMLDYGIGFSEEEINSNDYLRRANNDLNRLRNAVFAKGNDLTYFTADDVQFEQILDALDGEDNAKQAGIEIINSGEMKGFKITKDNLKMHKEFFNIVGRAYQDKSGWYRFRQDLRRRPLISGVGIPNKKMDGFYFVNNKNQYEPLDNGNLLGMGFGDEMSPIVGAGRTSVGRFTNKANDLPLINSLQTFSPDVIAQSYNQLANRFSRRSDTIKAGRDMVYQGNILQGATPKDALLQAYMIDPTATVDGIKDAKELSEAQTESIIRTVQSAGLINHSIRIYDEETEQFKDATSTEKAELQRIVQSTSKQNINPNVHYSAYGKDGNIFSCEITVTDSPNLGGTKNPEALRFIIQDLNNDPSFAEWNNDPYWQMQAQFDRTKHGAHYAGTRMIQFGTAFDGLSYQFVPNGDTWAAALINSKTNEQVILSPQVSQGVAVQMKLDYDAIVNNLQKNPNLIGLSKQQKAEVLKEPIKSFVLNGLNTGIFVSETEALQLIDKLIERL